MAKDNVGNDTGGLRDTPSTPKPNETRADLILEDKEGTGIVKEQLVEALKGLPDGTVICLCLGPEYADVPMTDAVFWPQHGAVFLLGEAQDDEDDEEVIPAEGTWVEAPREEEEKIHEAAEPA